MLLALSVYLPRWPIQRFARRIGQPDEHAFLLIEKTRGGDVIVCTCDRAENARVRAGISLAHAKALLGDRPTHVALYSAAEDDAELVILAGRLGRYSPVVAADPPDGLLLDLAGCEHLFGGSRQLALSLQSTLAAMGFHARCAVAPTVRAAWALARHAPDATTIATLDSLRTRVSGLPITALGLDADLKAALQEVGVDRVEQLFCLARNALVARYGNVLLRRLDELLGAPSAPIQAVAPEKRYEVMREFDGPITQFEIVELVVEELLTDLLAGLIADKQGANRLELIARRVDDTPELLTLTLTHPTCDPSHLWMLLRIRLERLHFGFGIEALRLSATEIAPLVEVQSTFWPEAPNAGTDTKELGELLDRMIQRLGKYAVKRVSVVESHIPETAFTLQPAAEFRRPKSPAEILIENRPTRLFAAPEPARVMAIVPDGPPVSVYWRGKEHAVRACVGPERIATAWWTEQPDFLVRDYYEAELADGRCVWLFRRTALDGVSGWYVHGEWS